MRQCASVDFGIAFFSETGKLIRFGTEIIGGFSRTFSYGSTQLKDTTLSVCFRQIHDWVSGKSRASSVRLYSYAFELEVEAGDYFGTGVILDHSPVFYPHEWVAEQNNEGVIEKSNKRGNLD